MSKFLTRSDKISAYWNAERYATVGPFGNGLEKLYQITSRKYSLNVEPKDKDEDSSDQKFIGWNQEIEPMTSSTSDIVEEVRTVTIEAASSFPTTPPNRRGELWRAAQPRFLENPAGDESEDFGTPGTVMSSIPGTEKRIAQKDFEKTAIAVVDEQSVNVCLESLLMALFNVMGHYGRIASDRTAFIVPKDNTKYHYQACVDGLIMTADRTDIMAFVETKRSLRSTNDSVLRQIGAQMAAFILTNDHVINKDRSEERSMWMVSMEGYQAFTIVATYDQAYVDYISSKEGSHTYSGFMTMVTSRAFDLRVWDQKMEHFFRDVAILMGGPKRTL